MSWDRVEAAVKAVNSTYSAMLDARQTEREGSKAITQAEGRWLDLLNERAAALEEQWDEQLDGFTTDGERKSLARVLQRYYSETMVPNPTKKKGAKSA